MIEDILKKETLTDKDIEFLFNHLDQVNDAGLVRLGLKEPVVLSEVEPAPVPSPEVTPEVVGEEAPVVKKKRKVS